MGSYEPTDVAAKAAAQEVIDKRHAALRASGRRRHGADTLPGIIAAYAFLALIAVGAVLVGVKMAFTTVHTVTKTVHAPATIGTTAQLQAALGKPTGQIAGTKIGLAGGTCDYYQRNSAQDLVLVCHG